MVMETEKRIEDFGEKIGGAKKDIWKERAMLISDLDEMDPREYGKYVKKDMVWHKPDYEKMVGEGMEPVVAYCVKYIRDKLPAKPVSASKSHAAIYIELIEIYRDILTKMKKEHELEGLRSRLFEEADRRGYQYIRARNYISVLRATSFSDYEIKGLRSEVELQGFPKTTSRAAKGLRIKGGDERNGEKKPYYVAKGYTVVSPDFDTYAEALKYAQEELLPKIEESMKPKKREKLTKIERPQLAQIGRKGEDYRKGRDVTGDDLLKAFEFRGGEFGNWNTQADRVACLNYGYEAFKDLAKVVRARDKFMSLGATGTELKSLGIAFGARGGGRASAHYEPEKAVINLTKMKGAGSLAHEWAHALDDFIGVQEKLGGYASRALDSRAAKVKIERMEKETGESLDVMRAFVDVMDAIKNRKMTVEEKLAKHQENLDRMEKDVERFEKAMGEEVDQFAKMDMLTVEAKSELQKMADGIKEGGYKGEDIAKYEEKFKELTGTEIKSAHWSRFDAAAHLAANTRKNIENKKAEDDETIIKSMDNDVHTIYYESAINLDGSRKKAYYQNTLELFARAFESYIEDKLRDKGMKSDYLVHGTRSTYGGLNPYPLGEERERINEKIAILLGAIVEKYDELQPELERLEEVAGVKEEEKGVEETEATKGEKFKLTLFKKMCKEAGLKVDMGETQKVSGSYLLEYTEGYIKTVRVPIYFEKQGNEVIALNKTSGRVKIHEWDTGLDYKELLRKMLEVEEKGKEEVQERPKEVVRVGKVEERGAKEQRIKEAIALRGLAKEHGLRLAIDDIRGLIYLYHGTSAVKSTQINKTGFEVGTIFAHAQTKTGYAGEGPRAKAKSHGKTGKVIEVRVEPDAIRFNKETGEFIAHKGLVKGEKWWIKGTGVEQEEKEVTEVKEKKEGIKTKKGIVDVKELRAVLLANIPEKDKTQGSDESFGYVTSRVIELGVDVVIDKIPEDKVMGCSKVWRHKAPNILEVDVEVPMKKKLEGILEGFTTMFIATHAGVPLSNPMVKAMAEGTTYMLCKAYGLDVRSYCKGETFEKMLQGGDKATTTYIKTVVNTYKEIVNKVK